MTKLNEVSVRYTIQVLADGHLEWCWHEEDVSVAKEKFAIANTLCRGTGRYVKLVKHTMTEVEEVIDGPST